MARHTTYNIDIMREVYSACRRKYGVKHNITEVQWNVMYDCILCDHVIDTLDWKIKNLNTASL